MIRAILFVYAFLFSSLAWGHHYKGLPHYSYFENYPQVPVLEFIKETHEYEVFTTIYNFQGLNLDQVESPDDVRFYVYVYDLIRDGTYRGVADFTISSDGQTVFEANQVQPEQENIFVIQTKIEDQGDLEFNVRLKGDDGVVRSVVLPISITEGFWSQYGLGLAIAGFFVVVISIKLILNRAQRQAGSGDDR